MCSRLGDYSCYGYMRLAYEIQRWSGQTASAGFLTHQTIDRMKTDAPPRTHVTLLPGFCVLMSAILASSICIRSVGCLLSKRSWRSLVAEMAVFGVADAAIAAKATLAW